MEGGEATGRLRAIVGAAAARALAGKSSEFLMNSHHQLSLDFAGVSFYNFSNDLELHGWRLFKEFANDIQVEIHGPRSGNACFLALLWRAGAGASIDKHPLNDSPPENNSAATNARQLPLSPGNMPVPSVHSTDSR